MSGSRPANSKASRTTLSNGATIVNVLRTVAEVHEVPIEIEYTPVTAPVSTESAGPPLSP